MRRLAAALTASVGAATAVALLAHGARAVTPEAQPVLRIAVPSHRCFTPNGRVPVTISGAAASANLNITAERTAAVSGQADQAGRVRRTIIAPTTVGGGRRLTAQLITVTASRPDGQATTASAPFVLATRAACAALNGR